MELKKNDTFNGGRIIVEDITPTHIIICHVPSGHKHTLSKAQVQEMIDQEVWLDQATWSKLNYSIF